ncbi:hypothetical protein PENSPDRAFT_648833 [Peniophora sp. CONT]|nr:hypothetical protein PENSPDRAFT_648833 [Peniophora sp. CONT]
MLWWRAIGPTSHAHAGLPITLRRSLMPHAASIAPESSIAKRNAPQPSPGTAHCPDGSGSRNAPDTKSPATG